MIELNDEILENCILCTSKDEARPNLQSVFIKDVGERRHYVATDGAIIIRYDVGFEGEKLDKPILIKPNHKIKKTKDDTECWFDVYDKFGVLTQWSGVKTVFDLLTAEDFPKYDNIFEDVGKEWPEYTALNPRYVNIALKVFDKQALPRPFSKGEGDPKYWEDLYSNKKFSGNVEILIMPQRV